MIRSIFYFTLGAFPAGGLIMIVAPTTPMAIWTFIMGAGLIATLLINGKRGKPNDQTQD